MRYLLALLLVGCSVDTITKDKIEALRECRAASCQELGAIAAACEKTGGTYYLDLDEESLTVTGWCAW